MPTQLETLVEEEREQKEIKEQEYKEQLRSTAKKIKLEQKKDEHDLNMMRWAGTTQRDLYSNPIYQLDDWRDYSPSKAQVTPGKTGAFMQGLTFGREDLFGKFGGGFEPTTTGEKALSFAGSMLPLVASTLALRYPLGYSMAMGEATGLLSRIGVEVGAGLVTDVGLEVVNPSDTLMQTGGLIALGVALGAFMPGSVGNYKKLINQTVKVADEGVFVDGIGKGVQDIATKEIKDQFVKVETGKLTPKIITPNKVKTDVAKKAIIDSPTQGEAGLRAFNDITEAWTTRLETVNRELLQELDEFPVVLNKSKGKISIDPQTAAAGHGARITNNATEDFIDSVGGLTDFELKSVYSQLDEAEIPFYDKEIIKERIDLVNQGRWLEGTPEKYPARVLRNMEDGANRNDEFIGQRVDDLVTELRNTGTNLQNRLRPYTTVDQAEKYLAKLDELETKLNDLPNQDKELITLRDDLDMVVNYLKDENIEFNLPRGYSNSVEMERILTNLTKAGYIYKDRPDMLKAELDALASLSQSQDEALSYEFRKTMNELNRYKAEAEEHQVDRILQNLPDSPTIDTLNIYNKAKAKLIEQLKVHEPDYEQYRTLDFTPGAESTQMKAAFDQRMDQQASEMLGGSWDQIKPIVDAHRDNPNKVGANIVRTRAVAGDQQAKDYINFEAQQLDPVVYHGTGGIDATAEHTASTGSKKTLKDVERVTLDIDDVDSSNINKMDEFTDDRVELGDNFFARNLSDFKTRVGVYINKLKKTGDETGVRILQSVEQAAYEATWAHRDFIGKVANINDARNVMTDGWKKAGILDQMLASIDDVSTETSRLIREAPDDRTGIDQANAHISEWLSKQSPEVRSAYNQFRAFEDKKFNEVSEFIDEMNLKHNTNIKKPRYRPGYTHFVYDGDWTYTIINDGVKTKIPATSKTELANALTELATRGENLDNIKLQVTPRWANDVEDFSIADSALKDGEAFGVEMSDLKNMYDTHGKFRPDDVIDVVFGALRGRTLGLESRKKALRDSIAISDRLHTRYISMLEPNIKLQQAVTTLEQANFSTLAGEMKLWANDMLGKSRNMEQSIDKHLSWVHKTIDTVPGARYTADSLGMRKGGRPLRAGLGLLASTGRMLSIGFNPMTAMIQLTQGLTNVAPLTGAKNFYRGWRNLKSFVKDDRFKRLAIKANIQLKHVDGGLDSIRSEVTSSGWGSLGVRNISKPRISQTKLEHGVDLIEHWSMVPFNIAENRQRLASLYAFTLDADDMAKSIKAGKRGKGGKWDILEDIADVNKKSIDDIDVHDQYALRMLDKTQFDFDTPGIAAIATNPLFKLPLQFKTYFMQEFEFLMGRKLSRTPAEQFKTLGVFLGLGGVAGLPFAEDIDAIATKMFGKSPMLWMYANAPSVVVAGFPALANMNLAPLINMGGTRSMNIMPGFGGVLSSKLWRAKKEYENGNAGAVEAILGTNTMARNFIEAMDMNKYGAVYAPGGKTKLREGGTLAAIGEGLGIQTYDNSALNALRLRKYHVQKDINARRKREWDQILNSDNPYSTGKKLGYNRKDIRSALKEREKGVDTGNVSKVVDNAYAEYENKIVGGSNGY